MVRVLTDSGANLTPDLVRTHNITLVPLIVNLDGQIYREGVDLSNDEFYQRLPHASPPPTTSQPTPADYEKAYRDLIATGAEVVAVTLSSKLSGTYNSAVQGKQLIEGEPPITVVDSLSASAAQGVLTLIAAQAAHAGCSRAEIVAMLEGMVPDLLLAFSLDTLEYLRRGGRIGGARALLGTLLRIKPVLIMHDGKVEAGGRSRNRRGAIEQLVTMAQERFGEKPLWVGMAHAVCPDDMQALAQEAKNRLNIQELVMCEIGPVIGAHTGPGTLGISAIPTPDLLLGGAGRS